MGNLHSTSGSAAEDLFIAYFYRKKYRCHRAYKMLHRLNYVNSAQEAQSGLIITYPWRECEHLFAYYVRYEILLQGYLT